MSLFNHATPFDLHCAQAVADHQALRMKQLEKAQEAAKKEIMNQPGVASKIFRPGRQTGMCLRDEDESYKTTLMEVEPMPERPALRVLNLLSRMGPPAQSTNTPFKTKKETVHAHNFSEKGVPNSHKRLAAAGHSRRAEPVTCKDWNYGGYDACEEGCYYEHICEYCFEKSGARHAHPYIKCQNILRVGETDEEVVVQRVPEGLAVWGDSSKYPEGVRKTLGQGSLSKRRSDASFFEEPLVRDVNGCITPLLTTLTAWAAKEL
ncbi:hypothetical protein FRC01_002116 [Tulasnella sp. 417]|nr:hypothetical protein FRC01_002116 [Tulasnella sp. 417]